MQASVQLMQALMHLYATMAGQYRDNSPSFRLLLLQQRLLACLDTSRGTLVILQSCA